MTKDIQIGLKLYSTNTNLISEAQKLLDVEFYDFVELYVVPQSFNSSIKLWKNFGVKFIIHAPHSYHGINFAKADLAQVNRNNFDTTQSFAEELNADIIIVHCGNDGLLSESIKQIKALNDRRIIIENKPKISLDGKICVGYSPSEFLEMQKSGILNGIAIDFGHAVYASNSLCIDSIALIKELLKFRPKIFHVSDGYSSSQSDVHLNLGKGDLRITDFISLIPNNSMVTIETPREGNNLKSFINDVEAFKKLIF